MEKILIVGWSSALSIFRPLFLCSHLRGENLWRWKTNRNTHDTFQLRCSRTPPHSRSSPTAKKALNADCNSNASAEPRTEAFRSYIMKSIHNGTMWTFVFSIQRVLLAPFSSHTPTLALLGYQTNLAFRFCVVDIVQIIDRNRFHEHIRFNLFFFFRREIIRDEPKRSSDRFMESKKGTEKEILLNVMRKWTTRASYMVQVRTNANSSRARAHTQTNTSQWRAWRNSQKKIACALNHVECGFRYQFANIPIICGAMAAVQLRWR